MSKVYAVHSPEKAALDVVFVHGLDGDAYKTWMRKKETESFWPQWLASEFDDVAVWTVDYDAWSSGWRGQSMPIQDRAVNLMALLETKGIGERPICFVTHSMGGLLVKEILMHASDGRTEFAAFAPAAKGIVFLATPHTGSGLTKAVNALGILYRGTDAVEDLKRNAAYLRHLSDRYRNWADETKIRNLVFFETHKTKGLQVVDETSANPGLAGVTPIGVDADHTEIGKPEDRDSLVYGQIKRFITKLRTAEPADQPRKPPEPRIPARSGVTNIISGHVTGPTFQARTIGGGIHQHYGGPVEKVAPSFEVGSGEPGWSNKFRRIHAEVGRIGRPTSELRREGPGVVQDFENDGWVLCALPDQDVTAVAEDVWSALRYVGGRAAGMTPFEATGFPEPGQIIGNDATQVALTGGAWKSGVLKRDSQGWRWEPVPKPFIKTHTPHTLIWPGVAAQPMVRALTTLPWADECEITPERRAEIVEALPSSELTRVVGLLFPQSTGMSWKRGPNGNTLSTFSYVLTPDGQPGVSAEVMVSLPTTTRSSFVSCAELRFESGRLSPRLTWWEIVEFLAAASTTSATLLPRIASDNPAHMRWTSPPQIEFRLTSALSLADLIDFTPLGESDARSPTKMVVTVNSATGLDRDLTAQAITHMAHSNGYVDATVRRLRS
ncbi:hypothetical protein JOF56_010753 [Kibdelosporangium banguiense]|uniref:AB hydrolase-1 domain-containing protein n=1 Tax=Kibdelosporangium banguiense TaxID=1365924 RepID=A0ABS4U2C2_9PSEU|nr:alpha/beta fold hydrolase [Kibdelosporangium banguiense]MBP2330368.1 hypothetical protein [Kibdelosporangium banguiense]